MSQTHVPGGDQPSELGSRFSNFEQIEHAVKQDVTAVAKERSAGLTPRTAISRAGLDSLERLEIIARVERRFQVQIPEVWIDQIECSQDLAAAVEKLISKQASSANERVPVENYIFEKSPEYCALQREFAKVQAAGEEDPFFAEHDSISNQLTIHQGRQLINFSGNNYLGFSGDPIITEASIQAIRQYGTSVSASRVVSGTRPIHNQLERAICEFLGVPDCVTFTAGHTTNALVLGHLFGPQDLILHDELVHNSILVGCRLAGAQRRSFPHNDWQAAADILRKIRKQHRRAVVIIEGLYSMDGDYPDLPRFVEIKEQHQSWLYVDEAHSIGTLGQTGRGLAEIFGLPRGAVEIWMGTLSKAIGACGGFIAGSRSLVQYLKYTCPGVVFTIGLSPASCGAALAAFEELSRDNQRVRQLQANARYLLQQIKSTGLNTGDSCDSPIIPVILGESLKALRASRRMNELGVSVQPIMYPAVPDESSRLRFFVNALHTHSQLDRTVEALQLTLG